jgi:hypothetical protein
MELLYHITVITFGNKFAVVNSNTTCDRGGLNGITNEVSPHCEDPSAHQSYVADIFTVYIYETFLQALGFAVA